MVSSSSVSGLLREMCRGYHLYFVNCVLKHYEAKRQERNFSLMSKSRLSCQTNVSQTFHRTLQTTKRRKTLTRRQILKKTQGCSLSQSTSDLFIRAFFCSCHVVYTSVISWTRIFMLHSIWWQFSLPEFEYVSWHSSVCWCHLRTAIRRWCFVFLL